MFKFSTLVNRSSSGCNNEEVFNFPLVHLDHWQESGIQGLSNFPSELEKSSRNVHATPERIG